MTDARSVMSRCGSGFALPGCGSGFSRTDSVAGRIGPGPDPRGPFAEQQVTIDHDR